MKRKTIAALLAMASALTLSACGSLFEREYVSIESYTPTEQTTGSSEESVTVHSFSELQKSLQSLVYAGNTEGTVTFDPDYTGNAAEDLASVTWQLRTGDALFAYCVDNISYELTQIVTYYEADIHVTYGKVDVPADDIVVKSYFTGIDTLISQTMEAGQNRLVFLVNYSLYDEDDVRELVVSAYHKVPYVSPHTPDASVNVYSGTGTQRLYEVTIDYGATPEELQQCRDAFTNYDPFGSLDTESMTGAEKAAAAYQVVGSSCVYDETAGDSAYAALFEGKANSEGIALAYSELCRRLNVECQLVYGQYQWNDFTWNIVTIDGFSAHVDAAHAVLQPKPPDGTGTEAKPDESVPNVDLEQSPFMRTDARMWDSYRWDTVQYPACEEKPEEPEETSAEDAENVDLVGPEKSTPAESPEPEAIPEE